MRTEIVCVGTELLLGQLLDTNSAWLAGRLAASGQSVHFLTGVGDNHDRLVEVLRIALDRSDAVVVTGGLGPTQDDITREAISVVTGRPLRRDPVLADRIREIFASRARHMVDSNLRQADVPDGAIPIEMTMGTAPGLIVPAGRGCVLYAMPGVPAEMKEMFRRSVDPDFLRRAGSEETIRSRFLRCFGISESELAERLEKRFEALRTGPATLAFLAGEGRLTVRLTVRAGSEESAVRLLDEEEDLCRELLGDVVFGRDDDTLESVVVGLLRDRGMTVAVGESMTGGLVGAWLSRVPGASDVFKGSAVTYVSEAKMRILGVPSDTLQRFGPVSEQTAAAMALGARAVYNADVGLSVTGSAGPDAQEGSVVGEAYVGIALGGVVDVRGLRLPGDRERVRSFATASLLNLLRKSLAS